MMWRAAVTALALALTGTTVPTGSDPAVVTVDSGQIRGTVSTDARTFQGIPYAAPPTGDRRWRPPQPAARWSGVRDATSPGSWCAQVETDRDYHQHVVGAEDCLYLNVTTPRSGHRDRPVLVFLHGGSLYGGNGSDYDAHRMAAIGDVVVVTVNYRLGVLGFFGHPGLAGSGTFGLQDQQAALRWVRHNAAAFGGDPHNVTLSGQSAGALSTCAQLTSPSAAGLFQHAILQSGSCQINWPDNYFFPGVKAGSQWAPLADVAAEGTKVPQCPDAADRLGCLRGVDAAELVLEYPQGFKSPAYGTPVLPLNPAEAVRTGRFDRIPVLSGGTRDEQNSLVAVLNLLTPVTVSGYQDIVRNAFGDRAGEVLAAYPATTDAQAPVAWAAGVTDRVWSCPTLTGDRLLARHTPVYAYEFADRTAPPPPPPPFLPRTPDFPYGAYHAAELPYLFDVNGWTPRTGTPLSDDMIRRWARFAATGDPGWKRFDGRTPVPYVRTLAPGAGGRGTDLAAEHRCQFWATMP
jgi:para-nitrobenzyl esterase